jgi:hypothetical protein
MTVPTALFLGVPEDEVARLLATVDVPTDNDGEELQEAHFIEWLHPRGRGGEWITSGIHHHTSAPEPGVAKPAAPRVGESFTGEDFAKAMDGFQHAGIVAVRSGRTKTQNLYGEVWLNLQKVGEIEPVGLARVTLKPPNLRGERHAELSNIYLRGSEQGNGFGAAFTNHFLGTLRDAGVDKADVEAVSVGGYAWARRGFVWTGNKQAVQKQILADAKKDGRWKQIASRATEQTMTELERKLTAGEFGSEAELAGWGLDHWWWETPPERHDYSTGTGPPKTRNWPGKELMIGSHWKGELDLREQPPEPEPAKWPEPESWQTQGFGAREPSDEGEFKTQMQSAREFANKAFTSSGTTTDEQWALSSYQASGFVHVNEFLRNLNPEVTRDSPSAWYSTPPSGATVGQMIDRLDSAIGKSTLKENVTVYRGGPVGQFANLHVGDEVRDPAFVSTSLRSPIAARPGDEVTSIRLPAGIHAFAFEEGLHIGGGSGLPESEVLLPRNTTFRVAEVNEDQWGNRSVILEALPPQAQDVR